MISGRLHMHGIALSQTRHGGEVDGNEVMLRRQSMTNPKTGHDYDVPFISGNSFKHMIREYGARFALQAVGLDDDAWTKVQRDLFISGGDLAGGSGGVDLQAVRQLEEAFPILRVCGYSVPGHSAASKLNVDPLQMICRENEWRVYGELADHDGEIGEMVRRAMDEERAAAHISDSYGTRHEPKNPNVNRMLEREEREKLDSEIDEKAKKKHADKGSSIQMIHDFEVLQPGSQWQGCVYYRELSDLEAAALAGALHHACEDVTADGRKQYRIGGRESVGYGRFGVRWIGSLREDIRPPEHIDSDAIVEWGEGDEAMEAYVDHLREHTDDIREAVEALV